MRVYLGTDSHSATDDMTATHATVRHLTCRVEGLGHKIFMDNFFSSPRLFDDLDRHKIHSCGTVQPNRRDMPHDFGPKQLKFKRDDVRVRTWGGLTTSVWKDRWKVYLLTNMDPPPAEGNFVTTATAPWNLTSWNTTIGTWVMSTIPIVWLTAIRWVDTPSSGPWNYFSTFWIWQYSTVGNRYLHVGLNIPTEISGSFWWGIWLRKLERAKITPPPDWLEDHVWV